MHYKSRLMSAARAWTESTLWNLESVYVKTKVTLTTSMGIVIGVWYYLMCILCAITIHWGGIGCPISNLREIYLFSLVSCLIWSN